MVSTFGDKRSQNLDTHVVKFMIATQKSSAIILHANVLPQITGFIKRGPPLEKELEFIYLWKLADIIPESSKSTTDTVNILVGV